MGSLLLTPPITFLILLVSGIFLFLALAIFTYKPKGHFAGEKKAYACGEEVTPQGMQPDYSQFFPFAFFFTIMHVVTLIIATVPSGMHWFAFVYLLCAAVGLSILYRKEK